MNLELTKCKNALWCIAADYSRVLFKLFLNDGFFTFFIYHSKSLVAAVPKEDALVMQVARGTEVMARHESAVVDLCQGPGATDKEVENCVVDFLVGGYEVDEAEFECEENEDGECLIDNMMDMWAEELPPPPTTGIADQSTRENAKKVKPWSSRSSPSGTFVRDPVTGEMRNIDETDWENK